MIREIWLIALGSLVPTIIALLAGKALAGKKTLLPVLPMEKLGFVLKTWLFVSAVAVTSYLLTDAMGIDESTQTTVSGFLVPMISGAIFVRHRLQ